MVRYMRAVLDSKRDPQLLPLRRLLDAFATVQPEVGFAEWLASVQTTPSPEAGAGGPGLSEEEIAEHNSAVLEALKKPNG